MNKNLQKTLLFSTLIFISSCGPSACDCYEFWKWNGLAPYHISVDTDACHRKYGKYVRVKRGTREYGQKLTEVLRQKCNGQEVQNTPIEINLPAEKRVPKINETVFFGRAKLRLKEFNYPLGEVEFTNFNSGTSWAAGYIINTLSSDDKDTLKVEYSDGDIHTLISASTYKERFNVDENYLKDRILEIIENSEGKLADSNSFGINYIEVGNQVYIYGYLAGYDWILKGKYFNPKFINIKTSLEYNWSVDVGQTP